MPENYGLLNNMAQGIREGMTTYMTLKNQNRQNDMLKLAQGVQDGPNGLEYTPEKQQEVDAKRQITQDQMDQAEQAKQGRDITSDRSKRATGLLRTISGRPDIPDLSEDEATKAQGLIGTNMKTEASRDAAEAKADAYKAMLLDRQGNQDRTYGLREAKEASAVAGRIHQDPMIVQMRGQANNIDKGMNLINDPKNPPSVTTMHEVAQDFAAALSGKGVASDFKLKSVSTPTIQGKLAELEGFWKSNPNQPAPPEVVKFWGDMGDRLRGAYDNQMGQRAANKLQGLKTAYGNVPRAYDAAKEAASQYQNGKWREVDMSEFGGEPTGQAPSAAPQKSGLIEAPQAPAEQPGLLSRIASSVGLGKAQAAPAPRGTPAPTAQDPDAAKYSQMHGIPYDQAKRIIDARRAGQ